MADLAQDEAAVFDSALLLEEEIDRRRDLDRATDDAAEMSAELGQKGALYKYVQMRREEAKAALADLIDLDPKDAPGIAAAQVRVKEYLRACVWIDSVLRRGEEADRIIEDEFGEPKEQPEE